MDAGVYQGVRCFLSVDLVGSTGLKSNPAYSPTRENAADPDNKNWVDVHLLFYQTCLDRLIYDQQGGPRSPWDISNQLHFWRFRGDEVLLYSGRIAEPKQIFDILYRFCKVVQEVDAQFGEMGLGARGCMWAAGFPIRNREILVANSPPYFRLVTHDVTAVEMIDAPYYNYGQNSWLEFAGPEIDLGFMLSPLVNRSRVVVSLEVANFVARCPQNMDRQIKIHHVGWRPLKTLYDGTPYPILWVDPRTQSHAEWPAPGSVDTRLS